MAPIATSVLASALLLVSSFAECGAVGFLQASHAPTIALESVEETLLVELLARRSPGKILDIEASMRGMYMALPKNKDGRLASATVRYALHRYFVQTHGWYMWGLEPTGREWATGANGAILKGAAPALVQSLMEKHLQGKGMGLRELAVFAATMTDLVHQEATDLLHGYFDLLSLDTSGPLSAATIDSAMKAFLLSFVLLSSELADLDNNSMAEVEPEVVDIYPAWSDTYMWLQDLRLARNWELRSRRNPFVEMQDSFSDSTGFVQHLGHQFGAYQNTECRRLKNELVDRELQGTGRVPLSRFYANSEEWGFQESVDYLRNQGVLDESDRQMPSVMIANYVKSQTNCLKTSGFYTVCCMNECEGLLGHVEAEIEAPTAAPSQLVDVISNLPSDTVDAPRNLSRTLVSRLDDIAAHNGGAVPLYGRLFAQWMHHAYPRECPYPHVSATSSPMSPEEWMQLKGEDALEANEEEMRIHVASEDASVEMGEDSLPWDSFEEILIGGDEKQASRSLWSSLRSCAGFSLLGAVAAGVLRALPTAGGKQKEVDSAAKFCV